MITEYEYTGIKNEPNIETTDDEGNLISGIGYDIENGDMTDKSYQYATWWESTSKMIIVFENELSIDDKSKLDKIVTDNTGD